MQTLSVKEVATKLNKSQSTIRNWITSGKLKAKKHSNKWEIQQSDVNNLITNNITPNKTTQTELAQSTINKIAESVSEKINTNISNTNKEKELKKEMKQLSLENEAFKTVLKKMYSTIKKLEEEQKKMASQLASHQQIVYEQNNNPQEIEFKTETYKEKTETSQIENEEKAERWAKKNTNKWLDKNCRSGRSWRELATNAGEKVLIRGKMQKPRSHLHIIMKTDKSAWNRMKAKVVLEMYPSESQYASHYDHPIEVGG